MLRLRLEAFGAVQIVGRKWCGKTTTAMQQSKSVIKMQDPDKREGLSGDGTHQTILAAQRRNTTTIDEWQVAPVLWDVVRNTVDERNLKGQFILTGSTVVEDQNGEIMHTGTGRISKMPMYPMSLYESKESTGSISLRSLFDDPSYDINRLQMRHECGATDLCRLQRQLASIIGCHFAGGTIADRIM